MNMDFNLVLIKAAPLRNLFSPRFQPNFWRILVEAGVD